MSDHLGCRLPWASNSSQAQLRECDRQDDFEGHRALLTKLVYMSSVDMLQETQCTVSCKSNVYKVHSIKEEYGKTNK